MRVLVIGDHNPECNDHEFRDAHVEKTQEHGQQTPVQSTEPTFTAEIIAQAWQQSAPHVQVRSLPFAAESQNVEKVWDYYISESREQNSNPSENSQAPAVALITANTMNASWQTQTAQEIINATKNKTSRIMLVLPPYALPDAGAELLSEIVRLINQDGSQAQEEHPETITGNELLTSPTAYHQAVTTVAQFISQLDLVVTHEQNVPLTGMHGVSGAAALEQKLTQGEAQAYERINSTLVYGLTKTHTPVHEKPSLLAQKQTPTSYKDLSRHDAAGVGGGAGFALLAAGARALPLNRALSAQFDLPHVIAQSDLIVVNQKIVDGRTHNHSTLAIATEIAQQHAVPVIVLTNDQIMSTRELAAQGISACYRVTAENLAATSMRLALSWTPNR